jgi:hypothetical protein
MVGDRFGFRGIAGVAICSLLYLVGGAEAATLDSKGEIKLGVRTYVNARVGTEDTRAWGLRETVLGTDQITEKSRTFPFSAGGHLRQNRFFAEVELKHNLSRLLKEGFGPFALLHNLPFRVRNLSYGLTYRGEADLLFDVGPNEYSTTEQWVECSEFQVKGCFGSNPATGSHVNVPVERGRLRDRMVHRSRLFQAYLQADVGRFWFRIGRQILSWGETDSFRLLDNINPVDSSFGGFLIPLDERRVPLDMLRMQYRFGRIGPLSEAFLEMYGAIDDAVGWSPGTPKGSPWSFPNSLPSATTFTEGNTPARNFRDIRGGGKFQWNWSDGTFSVAHYYTYVDTPSVESTVKPDFPTATNPADPEAVANASFPGGFSVVAVSLKKLVQITGATMTWALPEWYSILRSEVAYFNGEPRFRQEELTPFTYHLIDENGIERLRNDPTTGEPYRRKLPTSGGERTGDAIRYVLGLDINQFVRWINPHQTLFISTQFFYSHLFGAGEREPIWRLNPVTGEPVLDSDGNRIRLRRYDTGEVLPVSNRSVIVPTRSLIDFGALDENFIRQPTDSFLHTLFIGTSYRSGTINPAVTFFYDWGGAWVFQPAVTFIHDPFRFAIDYSFIEGHTLKGGSGVSLLRDRDNIQFRFEYVI